MELYNTINLANIPYPFYAQYQAGPSLQYQLDAAFPGLKLGIEADSKTFHSSPVKIQQDKQRDINLATQGWTILRFTEEEIEVCVFDTFLLIDNKNTNLLIALELTV